MPKKSRKQLQPKGEKYILRVANFKELKHKVKKRSVRHYHAKGSNVYTTVAYTGKVRVVSRYIYTKDRDEINKIFDKYEKKFRKGKADDFAGSSQKVYGRVSNRYNGRLAPGSTALESAKHRSIKRNTGRDVSTALRVQMEYELAEIEAVGSTRRRTRVKGKK